MKDLISFKTVCQRASCLLADFDAPRLQTASALYRRDLLSLIRRGGLRAGRASPERRLRCEGAEVEAPRQARDLSFGCNRRTAGRAHCSRFVNNAG